MCVEYSFIVCVRVEYGGTHTGGVKVTRQAPHLSCSVCSRGLFVRSGGSVWRTPTADDASDEPLEPEPMFSTIGA